MLRAAVCVLALAVAVGCGKTSSTTEEVRSVTVGDPPKVEPKSKPKEEPPHKGEVAGLVDLQVLAQDYRANQVGGDEKYLHKRLTCEGYMHKLEKLDGGECRMSFEYFVDGFNMRQGIVFAYFPASEAGRLGKYEWRSPVYFSGRCEGLGRDGKIALRDCRIVPPPKKGLPK